MRSRDWPARLAAIGVLIAYSLFYVIRPGGTTLLSLVSDTLFATTAVLAACLSLRASTRFDRGVPQRRVWFHLALGLALWAIAEWLWAYYQLGVGDAVPYPSPADIIWGVGFAPLLLGLFLGHRGLGVRLSGRQRLAAVAVYALLLTLLAGGMLMPMYFNQPGLPFAEAVIGTCYLVGDLTLAFIASLSLTVLWSGLVRRPWLPIAIGFLLFAISDSIFAYADWAGKYAVGANLLSGVIDVAYLAAYLSIALGAFRQATLRLADATQPRLAPPSRD